MGGLKMDPNIDRSWTSFWEGFGSVLGLVFGGFGSRFGRCWESFWDHFGVVFPPPARSYLTQLPSVCFSPAVRPKLINTITHFASSVSSLPRGVVVATVLRCGVTLSMDVMARFACSHHPVVSACLRVTCARQPLDVK